MQSSVKLSGCKVGMVGDLQQTVHRPGITLLAGKRGS